MNARITNASLLKRALSPRPLKFICNASIGPRQTDIHLRDAFRKSCRILRDLRDRQQIRIRMNRRRGGNVKTRW